MFHPIVGVPLGHWFPKDVILEKFRTSLLALFRGISASSNVAKENEIS
jgi:hypothetical protein